MGSKHPCRDHSFILDNSILRSVHLSSFDEPISNLSPLATWLVPDGAITFVQGKILYPVWVPPVILTSFALSMAVNTLVTGLIVFRILKVFLEIKQLVKPTSIDWTLGSTGGTTLQHIIFVIIESGMALFAIQLVRFLFFILPTVHQQSLNLVVGINETFNVIIRSVHFYFFCFTDNITWLGHRTNNNYGAGLNEIVLR